MKKIISTAYLIFIVGILSVTAQCCNHRTPECEGSKTKATQNKSNTDVKAYYFHATHRCATCKAVEAVTKEALKEYYGDKVAFQSLNIDEEKDNALIKKYKISGQTLLFIKGDKVVDLTNDAFMNARTNPEKLKAKIKSTIDSMM